MEIHLTEPEDTIITLEEGSPGLSAYELALSKGFEGTLEEWLESLKGGGDIPTPPSEGTYVLKVVDGVFSWVEDSSESDLPFEVESFLYNDSDFTNILSYNPPNVPLKYPPADDIYVIMFKLSNDTEVRRVEVNIDGVWTNLGAAFRANTQVAGAEDNFWIIVIPYDFDYLAVTELPITLDTQFKIVSMDNDEVIATTPINYIEPVEEPTEPEGPFSVNVVGRSIGGVFQTPEDSIVFTSDGLYIEIETNADTPFDKIEAWNFNNGEWYTLDSETISYNATGEGRHVFWLDTTETMPTPTNFPEVYQLEYKFTKGSNTVVVEDLVTFSGTV